MTTETDVPIWRERLLDKLRDPAFDFDFTALTSCIIGAAKACGMSLLIPETAHMLEVSPTYFKYLCLLPYGHGVERMTDVTREMAIASVELMFKRYPLR